LGVENRLKSYQIQDLNKLLIHIAAIDRAFCPFCAMDVSGILNE
jgi:uncharacterized radical SAM superfamily Fe-S cluster-containing enzyme